MRELDTLKHFEYKNKGVDECLQLYNVFLPSLLLGQVSFSSKVLFWPLLDC